MVEPTVAGSRDGAGDAPPAHGEDRALCARTRTVWQARGALLTGVVLVAGVVLVTLTSGGTRAVVGAVAGGATVLGLVEVAVLAPLRYRRWHYRLGPATLELSHGVLTRRTSTVPYVRIQHIDLTAGPLERRLELTQLALRTAASTTLATLPGVDRAEGERLRATILQRAGLDDAV